MGSSLLGLGPLLLGLGTLLLGGAEAGGLGLGAEAKPINVTVGPLDPSVELLPTGAWTLETLVDGDADTQYAVALAEPRARALFDFDGEWSLLAFMCRRAAGGLTVLYVRSYRWDFTLLYEPSLSY